MLLPPSMPLAASPSNGFPAGRLASVDQSALAGIPGSVFGGRAGLDLDWRHVRHRAKYIDFDVVPGQEFMFTENGKPIGSPARSLKQFATLLARYPASSVGDHARQGDFSRWIANVFHDNRLASDVRKIEQRYRLGHLDNSGALRNLTLTSLCSLARRRCVRLRLAL